MKRNLILFLILTSTSMGATSIYNRLNGGEMSPLMKSRTDFDKYYSGYQTVENFLVLPQGGITRRAGSRYIGSVKDPNYVPRLIPFVASTDEAYVMEFGDQYIRFYTNGTQLQSGGSAYEVTTPYQNSDLPDIRYVHNNDVIYLVHPNYNPRKLTRTSDVSWTLVDVEWSHMPFRQVNTTPTQMKVTFEPTSVSAWADATDYAVGDMIYILGDDVTGANDLWFLTCIKSHTSETGTEDLDPDEDDFYDGDPAAGNWSGEGYANGNKNTYWYPYAYYDGDASTYYYDSYIERGAPVGFNINSGSVFDTGMVGSSFQITHTISQTVMELTKNNWWYSAGNTYTIGPARVLGKWTVTTYDEWAGKVKVWRSFDYGNHWTEISKKDNKDKGTSNFTITGTEDLEDVFYKITYDCTDGSSDFSVDMKVDSTDNIGEVLLTSIRGTGYTPDGAAFSSYTDCLSHYRLNDNSAADSDVLDSANSYDALLYSNTDAETTDAVYDAAVYKSNEDDTAAFDFESTTEHNIECPASLITALGAGSRTTLLWIRPGSLIGQQAIFDYSNTNNGEVRYGLRIDATGRLKLYVNRWTASMGTKVLEAERWYFVAITYDASSGRHAIYVDNETDIEHTWKVNDLHQSRLMFGAQWFGSETKSLFFDGHMDNILIYDRVLSKQEIIQVSSESPVAYGTVTRPIFTNRDAPVAACDYTNLWAESAWSDYRGYPRCGTFYQQRLFLAGTLSDTQTVWASVSDDYESFRAGTLDDDSIAYTLSSGQNNEILWMTGQEKLGIGTSGGEFVMASAAADEPITPTSAKITTQSTYGSANEQSILINDATLFLQRNSKKIREFIYNLESDGYVAHDMTILSEHITGTGISQMTSQQSPCTILWTKRNDGQLLGFTYERNHDVTAWHRHTLGGSGIVEAIASIPGTTEDELWLIVRRTINGSTARYIEQILLKNMQDIEANDFFVDAGVATSSATATTITGLDHLEGSTVAVVIDRDVLYDGMGSDPNYTVTSGSITVPSSSAFHFTDDSGDLPFSIAGWFYKSGSANEMIVSKSDGWTSAEAEYLVYKNDLGHLYMIVTDASETTSLYAYTPVLVDGWHHFICTYDGEGLHTGINIYIDGESARANGGISGDGTYSSMEAGSLDVAIGSYSGGGGKFNEKLDDIRIYAEELSSAQASALYNSGDGTTAALYTAIRGWFKLDETTGTTLTDSSGHHHDGLYSQDVGLLTSDGAAANTGTSINFNDSSYATITPTYYVGLPYTSKLQTMPLAVPGEQLSGRTKRITSVTLRTYRSLGGTIGTSWTTYYSMGTDPTNLKSEWEYVNADDLSTYSLITGDYEMMYDGDYETEASIYIQTDQPQPFTILGIMPEFEAYR